MRKEIKKTLIWIFLSLICFSCSLPKAPVENQESSKDKPDRIFKGHEDGIRDIAFSPDGSLIALGTNPVSLWDTTTWQLVKMINGVSSLVAFSPDGKWLACRSHNNTLGLWKLSSLFAAEEKALCIKN